MTDAELIKTCGGPKAFAKLLGLNPKTGTQRVSNWSRRKTGIPARVKLDHFHLFSAQIKPGMQELTEVCAATATNKIKHPRQPDKKPDAEAT